MRGTDVLKHECPKDECGKATNAAELRTIGLLEYVYI